MKRAHLILVFLALVVIISGCINSINEKIEEKMEFREFISLDGSFSYSMPKEPKIKTENLSTVVGELPVTEYSLAHGEFAYMIYYNDYPKDVLDLVENKSEVLDVYQSVAETIKGKILSSKDISYGSYPGKETVIEFPGGTVIFTGRTYLIDNKLYQLAVTTPIAKKDSDNIKKFFDSFKLTGR